MQLKIENLGMNGEGVAKHEGKICFVDFCLPDEVVEAKIEKENKNFCVCSCENIVLPSKNRTLPFCKYFGKCGGCDIQHMNYESQLDFKKKLIEETFWKICGEKVFVEKVFFSNDKNYRNKSVFALNECVVGMKKQNSNEIIEIENCPIANDLTNKILKLFSGYIKNKSQAKNISHLAVRVVSNSAQIVVVSKSEIDIKDFSTILSKNNINFGLFLNINKKQNVILSNDTRFICGEKYLKSEIFGIKFSLSPNSFYQVNDNVQKLLYEKVLGYIDSGSVVFDCYSGAGLMSAMLSTKAKFVHAIEIEKSSSLDAEKLKQQNNISNLQNHNGDISKVLPKIIERNACVVLDPPRSGCSEIVLESIISSGAEKIVYVSCSPRTLARDYNILKKNYQIENCFGFDMFPNTKHVETILYLSKKS